MNTSTLHFFALLRMSLNGHMEMLDGINWQEVYDIAKKQSVLGLIYNAIEMLPEEQRPAKHLRMQWYADADAIRQQNALLQQRAVQLYHNLTTAGFRSAIIKGPSVASYYPIPELRTSGDIDVWVWKKGKRLQESRDKVVQFVYRIERNLGHKLPAVSYHHLDMPCFPDAEVEAHFTPSFFNSPFVNRRFQQFCMAERTRLEGLSEIEGDFPFVSFNFNLIFILQHCYRHVFGDGIGVRQILDYRQLLMSDEFLKASPDTIATIKHLGMGKFCKGLMWVMKEYLGVPEERLLMPCDEKEGRYLLGEMLNGGNFGHHDTTASHVSSSNKLANGWRLTRLQMRYLFHYPSEVLWSPFFRLGYHFNRLYHGYRAS